MTTARPSRLVHDQRDLPPGREVSQLRYDASPGRVGRDRLAPAGPHVPAARPTSARCARRRDGRDRDPGGRLRRRRVREPLPLLRPTLPRPGHPGPIDVVPHRAGRRPLRGRLLHLRPRASFADLPPERARARPGRLDRPRRRSSPRCPGSSRCSASRTAARRSASPSPTRTARSTPIRSSRRAPG